MHTMHFSCGNTKYPHPNNANSYQTAETESVVEVQQMASELTLRVWQSASPGASFEFLQPSSFLTKI